MMIISKKPSEKASLLMNLVYESCIYMNNVGRFDNALIIVTVMEE